MPKEPISATIDKKTADDIRKVAAKEGRSFSNMIDMLLQDALSGLKQKKSKAK